MCATLELQWASCLAKDMSTIIIEGEIGIHFLDLDSTFQDNNLKCLKIWAWNVFKDT